MFARTGHCRFAQRVDMGDGLSDIDAGRGFLLTRGGCGARADTPGIPPAAWRPCRHPASTLAFFWMRACFFTARTGPPGRAVHFREFSASRGGCIRVGSVYLISRDPSTGDLGWQTACGVAIARVSRRAVPQSDAGRAMLPVRGVAGGGRDAEYSGFCTVQAGVRWDGKGRPPSIYAWRKRKYARQ